MRQEVRIVAGNDQMSRTIVIGNSECQEIRETPDRLLIDRSMRGVKVGAFHNAEEQCRLIKFRTKNVRPVIDELPSQLSFRDFQLLEIEALGFIHPGPIRIFKLGRNLEKNSMGHCMEVWTIFSDGANSSLFTRVKINDPSGTMTCTSKVHNLMSPTNARVALFCDEVVIANATWPS